MAKDKRVEILFESRDYQRLAEIARRERKSVGSVVREAVAKYATQPADGRRKGAMRRLLALQSGIDWGTPEELRAELRRVSFESVARSLARDKLPPAKLGKQ